MREWEVGRGHGRGRALQGPGLLVTGGDMGTAKRVWIPRQDRVLQGLAG